MEVSEIKADPVKTAEVMKIVGLTQLDLHFPQVFQQVQDIVNYFSDKDVLLEYNKIMKHGVTDKIGFLWNYIQTKNKIGEKVKELGDFRDQFDDEVNKEIDSGYLTKMKQNLIEKQISHLERQAKYIESEHALKADERIIKYDIKKIEKIKDKMTEIAKLKKELEKYG